MNTDKSLLEAQNQPSFLGAVMRSVLLLNFKYKPK